MDTNKESRKFTPLEYKKPTMNETYKYYNTLAKSGKELESLTQFVSSDVQLPFFEEKLRLSLIDSLQLEKEVVRILLSQNNYQISKVLGFKWFFKNLPSEFCTKELFPYVSVSVRCKIISRLSKHLENTEEAQKYFEFIRKKYSYKRANHILSKCSPEFIWSYCEETKPTFEYNNEVRFLLNICKRYPELGVQILSTIIEIKKEHKSELLRFKKILCYLSGTHPDLMVPFIKKYHSYLPSDIFGIKLTKKLGSKLKKDLFSGLMESFLFNEKYLFLILNNEERVKYLAGVVNCDNQNLSFQNWLSSSGRISQLLKLISEEERLNMIQSVFKKVYNTDFNDVSKCWTSETLQLLPVATRKQYLQKLEEYLKKGDKSELKENVDLSSFSPEFPEKLVYLHDSSTAFEKFKDILRKCPAPKRRESVLRFMVKNCSINNDLPALEQLVEFIANRFRNDDHSVISSFANTIEVEFSILKLNPTIFEKLEELTYFLSLRRSSNLYTRWKEHHLCYRLENNMEVDVSNFFQSVVLKSSHGSSFLQNFNSKHSKTFVLAVCEKIIQWVRDNPDVKVSDSFHNTSETLLLSLIYTCKGYNENKNDRIFVRDIQGLEEILKKKAEKQLGDIGSQDWPSDFWEMMLAFRSYGDVVNSYNKPTYLSYIVKRKPELITKYLEGVLNTILLSRLKKDKTFVNLFKTVVSFLGIADKVKESVLNEFKKGDTIYKRKSALQFYSHMCSKEEFSSAIENYLPKQKRVEQKEDGFDEIQILIPNLIRNVKPRWKNFDLIFKFYFGDFQKNVISSLSACSYHTRYDFIIPYLKEQLKSAPPRVSYQKNIIRLIVELSDREDRSEFYVKCWDEYKHYSVRSILMSFISASFLEQPSQECFRVLEKCILESDEIVIESKPDLWKIPKEFYSDYVRLLWRFSENREKGFKDDFRRKILWGLSNHNNINLLPDEFSESIIRNDLFNSFSDNGIETFTALYLAAKPEFVRKRVELVLSLIETRKPDSRSVFDFFFILISTSQNRAGDFCEVFKTILENWPKFPLGVLFEERILLTYYYFYYEVLKTTSDTAVVVTEFGKKLKVFLSKIENDLVFIYAKVLKKFFGFLKTANAVLVVKEIVNGTLERGIAVLAILSLPDEAVVWHKRHGEIFNKNVIEGKKVVNEILNAVEGCRDDVVEIYMRCKFDFVRP